MLIIKNKLKLFFQVTVKVTASCICCSAFLLKITVHHYISFFYLLEDKITATLAGILGTKKRRSGLVLSI
jgi:hypothetical protein